MSTTETYYRTRTWGYWRGSISDVAEVVRQVQRVVGFSGPAGQVMIAVDFPGLKTDHTSAERLVEHLGDTNLAAVQLITIVSSESDGKTRRQVAVSFQGTEADKPAVSATVTGMDRIWTDGAMAALAETIERGKRWNPLTGRLRVTGADDTRARVPERVVTAGGAVLLLAVGAVLYALADRYI